MIQLEKDKVKPGVLCVYQLVNQPATIQAFHYGYFYIFKGKQLYWQELADKSAKLCQQPTKVKTFSAANCQFKQILNWP